MAKRTAEKQRPKKRSETKRVYISASRKTDVSALRQSLERRGVRVFSPDQMNLYGLSLSQITRKAMAEADIVIAVSDSIDSEYAFYEAGFAQALKKPTVAIIPTDASVEPWIARGIPYLRLDPHSTDSLNFLVTQILAVPHPSEKSKKVEMVKTNAIGAKADELLTRLRVPNGKISARILSEVVTEAIQASGVVSVAQESPGDTGGDLAVWSNDISPWMANPLPIQLELRLDGQTKFASAARMGKAGERSGMLWKLVIYLKTFIPLEPGFLPHDVLVMQAEDFLKTLKIKSFGDLVLGLRNERVHGRR